MPVLPTVVSEASSLGTISPSGSSSPTSSSSSASSPQQNVSAAAATGGNVQFSSSSASVSVSEVPPQIIATTQQPKSPEKMGVLLCAFFVFISTSSGAYGVESSVQTAGALPILVFVFVVPIFVMLPIILILNEFVSIFPTNAGNIHWIARCLGPRWGFINACYQTFMNVIDVSVYPAMASDYIAQAFTDTEFSWGEQYAMRIAIIIIFGLINLLPIKELGIVSIFITVIILAPFVVGFFRVAAVEGFDTTSWSSTSENINFSTLLSIGFWLYTGYLTTANLSGQCHEGALLRGQIISLVLGIVFYFLPLAAAFQQDPKWANWKTGYLSVLYGKILFWLRPALSLGGAISGIGLFMSSVSCYCRSLWGVSKIFLSVSPTFPLSRLNRYQVPWINVLLLCGTTCILNLFSFTFLVRLEFVFATVTYIFLVVAFLSLRIREPELHRPFRVPGGLAAQTIMVLPLMLLVCAVLGSDFVDPALAIGFVVMTTLSCILVAILEKYRSEEQAKVLERLIETGEFESNHDDDDDDDDDEKQTEEEKSKEKEEESEKNEDETEEKKGVEVEKKKLL